MATSSQDDRYTGAAVAQDSPVFREDMRRRFECTHDAAAEVKRFLRSVRDFSDAEHKQCEASDAVLKELDQVSIRVFGKDDRITACVKELLASQRLLIECRKQHADMVEALQGALAGCADECYQTAAESYKTFQKRCQQLDGLAERIAHQKEASKAAEMERSVAEAKAQHREATSEAVSAIATSMGRLRYELVDRYYSFFSLRHEFIGDSEKISRGFVPHLEVLRGLLESERATVDFEAGEKVLSRHETRTSFVSAGRMHSWVSTTAVTDGGHARRGSSPTRHSQLTTAEEHRAKEDKHKRLEIEGYLWKRSSNIVKDWKRRFFTVKDGKLSYFKTGGKGEPYPRIALDLLLAGVRLRNDVDRRLCFEVVSPERSFLLQAESQDALSEWFEVIGNAKAHRLLSQQQNSGADQSKFIGGVPAAEYLAALKEISEANGRCADCGAQGPDWASINIGILCCLKCSGIHRSLGVNVSKVRSFYLDTLNSDALLILARLGNQRVNEVFEANVPQERHKIDASSTDEERIAWIVDKYQKRLFVAEDSTAVAAQTEKLLVACIQDDMPKMLYHIAHGADINATFPPDYSTLLHIAVKKGFTVAACFLSLNNVSLNAVDTRGRTALHHAAENNDVSALICMVRNGATALLQDYERATPIGVAVALNNIAAITYLKFATAAEQEKNPDARASIMLSMRHIEKFTCEEHFQKSGGYLECLRAEYAHMPQPMDSPRRRKGTPGGGRPSSAAPSRNVSDGGLLCDGASAASKATDHKHSTSHGHRHHRRRDSAIVMQGNDRPTAVFGSTSRPTLPVVPSSLASAQEQQL